MTNRLDHLENEGLIARKSDTRDRRARLVVLTDKGRALIDRALAAHLVNETRVVSVLSGKEQKALNQLLAKFIEGLNKLERWGENPE